MDTHNQVLVLSTLAGLTVVVAAASKLPGVQAGIIPVPIRRVAAERPFRIKMGHDWGGTLIKLDSWAWSSMMSLIKGGTSSSDGVASRWIVSASASVVVPCTVKSKRWRSVMEDVDKGCSEFCVTVGTNSRYCDQGPYSLLRVRQFFGARQS